MNFLNEPLPHNDQAETAVIGAIILDNGYAGLVLSLLSHDDFYHPLFRRVFKAIKYLHNRGRTIDPITILEAIRKKSGPIESIGGVTAITRLTEGVPRLLEDDLRDYCATIKRHAINRKVVHLSSALARNALDPGNELETVLQEFEEQVMTLNTRLHDDGTYREKTGFRGIDDVADEMRDQFIGYHDGTIVGVTIGMPEIEALLDTGGVQAGGVYLLAAVEKAGKTSLLLDWAMAIEKQGYTVPIVTLEMAAITMSKRLFAKYTGIPYYKFKPGFSGPDYELAMSEVNSFSDLNIQITDNLFTLSQIERHLTQVCELAKRKGKPVKAAIVDYLQLIGIEGHTGNREQEVARISRDLKRLAMRLGIAIIIVSSMNRSNWGEGAPTTANLRDSHQLAYDAEAVFFLYDPEFKPGQRTFRKPIKNIDFIIDRQRNGPTDTVPLKFVGKMMTFLTLSQFKDTFGSEYEAEEDGFNRKLETKEEYKKETQKVLGWDEDEDDIT